MHNLRKKNQDYDAWLDWYPTYRCHLNCAYCFENPLKKTEKISEINTSALIKTLSGTNKTFKIRFTGGGEPFLIPNIVEACEKITQSHFVCIVSNLISEKIHEFSEKIDPKRVLYISASLQIKELERLNLLNKYIYNFQLCKKSGFNIKATVVAYPPLLDEVKKYRKFFQEKGIPLKFYPYIGKSNGKIYPKSYTENELNKFGLDIRNNYQKGKLCNVGCNVGVVNPHGYVSYCFSLNKPMGNVYSKIKFKNKMLRCPFDFCTYPLNFYDINLFKKAIKETNLKIMSSIYLKKYILRNYFLNMNKKFLRYEERKKIGLFLRKYKFVRF